VIGLERFRKRLQIGRRFPRFVSREARHYWHSRVLVKSDVRFGTRLCRFPRTINLKVTNACNLRCRMCGQWGDTGFHKEMPASELSTTLSIDDYRRIVKDCSRGRPDFYIWGGEPFVYPHIGELLEIIKREGLFLAVNSNGTRLTNHAERLVESGVDLLIVSVDGIREDHEAARGKGSFDAAVDGLKAVLNARRKLGKRYPLVAMACTITNWNYSRLKPLVDLAREIEVDHLDFGFPLFLTEKMGRAYQSQMLKDFDVQARSWTGFIGSEQKEIVQDQLVRQVDTIRNNPGDIPIMFFPDLKNQSGIEQFFTRPAQTLGRSCFAPWTHLEVQPDGKVYTCHDFPDLIVGDLRQQTVANVWQGEKMSKFRQFLRSGKMLSICGKCCRLYE
jgi:radical SAM protein with 4Fe4S-binding SPASM domain